VIPIDLRYDRWTLPQWTEAIVVVEAPAKRLVLDPRAVERVEGLRLVQGQVEKDPHNPLFQADKPWENALNNLYPNVVYDEQEGRYKLWYKCVLPDADAIAKMSPPRTVHKVGWYLCYATSTDGVHWEKPALGLHAFGGSKQNNIVARDTPNAGVFRDDRDPSPARRYKMIFDVGWNEMRACFSPDGIHWSAPVTPKGLDHCGDTHNNAFWDPADTCCSRGSSSASAWCIAARATISRIGRSPRWPCAVRRTKARLGRPTACQCSPTPACTWGW
jgi:hypothetical protein